MLLIIMLPRPDRESDSEAEDIEHAEKLRQVKAVLEEVRLILSFSSCRWKLLSFHCFGLIYFTFLSNFGRLKLNMMLMHLHLN